MSGGESQILSLLGYLLHLVAILNLVHENFCRLKTGHKMFVNYKGSVTGYIAGNFLLSLFVNEAAEPADVDIFSTGHVLLDYTEESFN